MKKNHPRRDFLKSSAAIGATAGMIPYFSWNPAVFANRLKNDRPQIGCIGMGGKGRGDARHQAAFGDIVAVCDVDKRHRELAKNHKGIGQGKADAYPDYRDVLDRKDIDVVSIATPDHWHVKIAIEALEAGKHVYCQKPLTLTLEENQLIRKACKKHKDKIFFVGTQQRSSRDKFLRAINMVQKGILGDIKKMTIGIGGGDVGGPFEAVDPPAELDWEQWLGPAPLTEYREKRCHQKFRWWYEYSGGKFSDWGAHHVDIATWAIGHDGKGRGPVLIDGADAKHPIPFENGYPTKNDHFNTAHDYNVICTFENNVEMHVTSRAGNGILFEGSKGRIFVSRGRITGKPIEENWDEGQYTDEDVRRLYRDKPYEGHYHNFFRCIAEGGLPVSDVFSHVQAMNTCHLAAIAARLGRNIRWDPQAEKIMGDDHAASFFAREQRQGYEIMEV